MSYISQSVGSQLNPKWLGTYECELIPLLHDLQRVAFAAIIDVGAAEGYYAVGSAIKWPQAIVTAFESTEQGRDAIEELAHLNGVNDRITIRGHCDVGALLEVVPSESESLVIMDVEGAEYDLLQPLLVTGYRRAHIVVELHERIYPELDAVVRRRFSATHDVVETWTRERTTADFAEPRSSLLRLLFRRSLVAAVDEWRGGPMRWLYLQPKART